MPCVVLNETLPVGTARHGLDPLCVVLNETLPVGTARRGLDRPSMAFYDVQNFLWGFPLKCFAYKKEL